ncbi:EAL domain-containing protein [Burkholderia territorii]|uniref:EAL domain-containing protein n=1 Tax=Burkholderia territorii TaxID=1503055 RepID=UPI000B016D83|nr:EAL domain-containing protein [Burkholderia territorii]
MSTNEVAFLSGRIRALEGQQVSSRFNEESTHISAPVADISWPAAIREANPVVSVELVCNPVFDINQRRRVLYREVEPCIRTLDGQRTFITQFSCHLERIGIDVPLDIYVIHRALDMLRQNPFWCVGIAPNVSSIEDTTWWAALSVEFGGRPDLSRRLVIEVAESAALSSNGGRQLRRARRDLGVAIAIRNFGLHYGACVAMELGRRPDVIKLDPAFVAENGKEQLHRTAGMVELASDAAPYVVVPGVVGAEALQLAKRAGALWIQGEPSVELGQDRAECLLDSTVDHLRAAQGGL